MSALTLDNMGMGAEFSPCRRYRYSLWRTWDPMRPGVLFVGLNPSTADETKDDPTIKRCIGFARDWGYGGLTMANVYAYRATDPEEMRILDPERAVGPENDDTLCSLAESAGLVVAAWGFHLRDRPEREARVLDLLGPDVHCLGVTADGHPRHPLYIRRVTTPRPYTRRLT